MRCMTSSICVLANVYCIGKSSKIMKIVSVYIDTMHIHTSSMQEHILPYSIPYSSCNIKIFRADKDNILSLPKIPHKPVYAACTIIHRPKVIQIGSILIHSDKPNLLQFYTHQILQDYYTQVLKYNKLLFEYKDLLRLKILNLDSELNSTQIILCYWSLINSFLCMTQRLSVRSVVTRFISSYRSSIRLNTNQDWSLKYIMEI